MTTAACTAGNQPSITGGGQTGTGSGSGSSSAPYLRFFPCCSWGTTWSFNPYNVNGLGIQNNLVVLQLAIRKAPSITDYAPQLADSWNVANGKLTIKLHPGAKWQDGSPVTSKDVYDTAILDGTRGDAFWNDITGITTPDASTVVFALRKGQNVPLALSDILPMIPYPSSVYGKFVTDQLAKDVPTYFAAFAKNQEQAQKLPEFTRMSKTFTELAALKVPKLIGDGPFKLENITGSEAKMPKSDTYWGADKIKIGGLDYLNGSGQAIYAQMFADSFDFTNAYMPPPILKRWDNTPDAHTALPLGFGFVFAFNSHKYPMNMTAVRQALAYVIGRQQMSDAAYGTSKDAGGTYKEVSTGISPSLEKLYLPQDKINQLNKYPVDPAKATQLLQSKGFKKQNGQWMMPNGKPFKLTWMVNSSTPDIVTSFNSAATALSGFGIKSDVNATSGAQQGADQSNGNFDIGMYFVGGTTPLTQLSSMLHDQNYTTTGTYAGKRGIGFGPKANVPGLGTVDVPSTIYAQSRSVGPGAKMDQLTWDWVRLVNEQVPYIWYATKVYQFPYYEKHFTNWPPMDSAGTSEL